MTASHHNLRVRLEVRFVALNIRKRFSQVRADTAFLKSNEWRHIFAFVLVKRSRRCQLGWPAPCYLHTIDSPIVAIFENLEC